MRKSMYDAVTIGNAAIDTFLKINRENIGSLKRRGRNFFLLSAGAKIPVESAQRCLGGNAANVAVGLRRFGLKTAFLSRVGKDKEGRFVYETIRKEKVSTRYMKRDAHAMTNESVILQHDNDKVIFAYHHNHHFVIKKIPKTRWLYISSLGQDFEGAIIALLRILKNKRSKTKVAYNPGCLELEKYAKAVKSLIARSSVVIVNKDEAFALLKNKYADTKTMLKNLRKLNRGVAVITDGINGADAFDEKTALHAGTVGVRVVNSTGAGDAFSSGFLASYIEKDDLKEALYQGSLNATCVVQHIGAQTGLIWKADIAYIQSKYPRESFKIRQMRM